MNLIRGLVGIALMLLGIWAFWTVAQGLISGEILKFAKQGHEIIQKNTNPDRFWIAIIFWTIGSVMLVGGGFRMAKKNF